MVLATALCTCCRRPALLCLPALMCKHTHACPPSPLPPALSDINLNP